MALKVKTTLEDKIVQFTIPPKDVPEGIPYASRLASMPIDFALKVLGFNNYREHGLEDTNNLSSSIKQVGLLEPITFAYDTKLRKWDFIGGEGRIWSCYQLGADEISTQIFYDVPAEIVTRMKIAENSAKTKIDPEDLAKFTKKLYDLMSEYNAGNLGQISRFVNTAPSIKDLAKITSRSPSTISKYMIFNNLHKELREYVDNNREKNFYGRSIKIGRAFPNRNHQRIFWLDLLKEESRREKEELEREAYCRSKDMPYTPKSTRLSDYDFKKRLKDFSENLKEPIGELCMRSVESNHKVGDSALKKISSSVKTTKKYLDAFINLVEYYADVRHDSADRIYAHIEVLKREYDSVMDMLPRPLVNSINAFLQRPPEKSFRDKILEQAELRRNKQVSESTDDINRIKCIGDKIVYIPVGDIVEEPSQLRTRYNQDSIDALVKEMKVYGQIKPGLVRTAGIEDGRTKYKVIYGHTRRRAVIKAGIKYYKAFIRDDLTDLEITMLQSMEDLSEHDTAVERAKVLNTQYHLMQSKASNEGKGYSKNDFVKEFSHLGTRKTIKDALEFMELDNNIRNMTAAGMIGYEAALKIGKLSEEDRFNVLYNVMVSNLKGKALDNHIAKVKAHSGHGQQVLFDDVPKSYSRVLEQFENQSLVPFYCIKGFLGNGHEQVMGRILTTPQVFIEYAYLYKSILRLERSMHYKNGY